ncbi:MAG: GGDEF domain-containing protein [Pseudomonadota bacterium]
MAPPEGKAFQTLDIPAADDLLPDANLAPSVRATLDGLIGEIRHLRVSLEKAYQQIARLENLADRDSLVPVFNRRAFTRELDRMISFGERYGTSQSVLYFDLNGMKEINDTHGHGAGDAALKLFATILVDNLRKTDIVGRLGGDEFAVILVQTDEATARSKAQELTVAVHGRALDWEGVEIRLRTACGVHTVRQGNSALQVLCAADEAMYRDKQKNSARKRGGRPGASPARKQNEPARQRIA